MTSSYLSTFLRRMKLSSSTFFCALSTTLLSILCLERLALLRAEAAEDAEHAVAGEQADELVLGREVEAALAGVALAAGAAAELVVDAPALVALRAEHVQAAGFDHALAELDVDAAAGHVGGDGDRRRAWPASSMIVRPRARAAWR